MKLFVTILSVYFISCSSQSNKVINESTPAADSAQHTSTTSDNWIYSKQADKMDGSEGRMALTKSPDRIEFKAPYDGGSSFSLMLRNKNNESAVMVTVSKGQFIVIDDRMRIKFDDEKPSYINIGPSLDGNPNTIFLYPADTLIKQIWKSKKLMIEPAFYNEGLRQISFNIAGLNW